MREVVRTPVDKTVVEQLYHNEFVRISHYAQSIVGDRHIAEDLAQEAFILFIGSPPNEIKRAGVWLRVVVRRLCIDWLRRHSRGLGKEVELRRIRNCDSHLSAESESLRTTDLQAVRLSLAELNEREQKALLMRHSGYSYREIAEATGMEPTAVGVFLLRTMKKWKKAFLLQTGEKVKGVCNSDGSML